MKDKGNGEWTVRAYNKFGDSFFRTDNFLVRETGIPTFCDI